MSTPSPSAQPVAVRERLQKWLDRANPFDQLYLPRAAITQILAALDAHPAPSAQPDAVRQAAQAVLDAWAGWDGFYGAMVPHMKRLRAALASSTVALEGEQT